MVSSAESRAITLTDARVDGVRSRLAERIGTIVFSIMALFMLTPALKVPALALPLDAFGTPLRLTVSRDLVVAIMSGLLAWAGSYAVLSLHPQYRVGARVYTHRVLPALAAIASAVLWQRQEGASLEAQLVLAVALGLSLTLVILAQYSALGDDSPWAPRLRALLSLVSLSVGLYLLTTIYGTRARSLVTATAAAVLAASLAIDILQYEAVGEWRLLRAAAVIGLVVGECAWALNYWRAVPLRAGFLLLIAIYILVGVTRRAFQRSLTPGALVEHGIVAAVLLAVMQRFT